MIAEDTCLRLAEDVTFQSVGNDQAVILSLASGYLFTANETTASFLTAIDGRRTFGQIIDQLKSEYDVPRDKLLADMSELVAKLIAEDLIVAPQAPGSDA